MEEGVRRNEQKVKGYSRVRVVLLRVESAHGGDRPCRVIFYDLNSRPYDSHSKDGYLSYLRYVFFVHLTQTWR